MSSNFFTNQERNTLKNKINHILKQDKNIEYLDFLIGYFRITGFDKISENLSNIKYTRILIGINTDKATYNATQLIKQFSKEQVDIYNQDPLDKKEYQNFQSLKKLIVTKRVEMKISANRDVHSKMYIMRSSAKPKHDEDGNTYLGSVIIGSSNLTLNGLEKNIEINAELKGNHNVEEALEIFEKLWATSVELTKDDFDKFITPNLKEPPKENGLTPYKLYIKLLIEHFGSRINFIDDKNIFVPKEYKKLSYQIESVNDGIVKLTHHNGFFLSDVVGLGKTVVIAMLLKKLESTLEKKVLVVIPPAVKVQWKDTFKEFNINFCDIVSLASLNSVKSNKYELIVVDESHKFKNNKSKRYKQLYEICLNKRVILLSATPQNNTPSDLYNQIALFQNIKNSTIANCRNLQSFFSQKEKNYKEIINSKSGIDKEELKLLSEDIRDNVLRHIMIRRTRYDIEHHNMYKADIKEQGLSFPIVKEPIEHEYKLKGELGKIFDDTAIKISKELNYSRFNLLYYLTKEAQHKYYPNESDNLFIENPLAGLMKTLLIKRFESSFSAFKISINRHLNRYEKFIENFEKDIVYLGESATDILDFDEESDVDFDEFIETLKEKGKIKVLKRKDFRIGLKDDLEKDLKIFKELVGIWKEIDQDPKVEKFKEILEKEKDKKIVIFTESVDTLNYLKDKLYSYKKILFITSQNRDEKKLTIQQNFDANYDKEKQKDDYTIIITTDTLAEGINLHRSSIIYNYDIPWNATKLIQRIGRVNRIGTKSDFIYIHNFKPASHIDNSIRLSQKALVKLQSSHTMMGEDNPIYTKEEQVSSVKLFEEYKKESQERDEEIDYLEELRAFRESNPKEFKQIEELEEGLVFARQGAKKCAYIVLDINGDKNYVYVDDSETKPISFIETAKNFKTTPSEVAIGGKENEGDFYLKKAKSYFEDKIKVEQQDKAAKIVDRKEEQEALLHLQEWFQNGKIDEGLLDKIEDIILNRGNILMAKNIKKIASSQSIKEDLEKLVANYKPIEKVENRLEIKEIISEIFKGKK